MSRSEHYFDTMLRHLGATYYQSLHGHGTAADVARAVESVTEADGHRHEPEHPDAARHRHFRRGHRWLVRDVMSADVVTVGTTATLKQIAQLMSERGLSGLPVLSEHRKVLGMVSEADVLRKQERNLGRLGTGLPHRSHHERLQAEGETAAELMSAPPITIHPDAPLGVAARLMNGHHIRRLPVVDTSGKLMGIVSRRDLLSVFVRPDDDIAADVAAVLTSVLLEDPQAVSVSVHDGVVTLAGALTEPDQAAAAVRLASDVDGVVSVTSELAGHRVEA